MQYTPQQMMGHGTFKSSTRIGNWSEDLALQEEKQKMIKKSRESGSSSSGSLIQQMHEKFKTHTQPETIEKQGPHVSFEKQLMLFNEDTKGFLAGDLDMVLDQLQEKYGVTTVAAPKPIARNVFVLEKIPGKGDAFFEENGEGDELHYGQQFRIRTCDSLSQEPLYLKSEPCSPSACAPVSSDQQQVSLTPHVTYATAWKVLYRDEKWRLEWENEKVQSNHPCIIQHCGTGQPLNSDSTKRTPNDFGSEFEVSCKKRCDTHKVELDTNVWYIVVGQGGRNSKSDE